MAYSEHSCVQLSSVLAPLHMCIHAIHAFQVLKAVLKAVVQGKTVDAKKKVNA